MKKTADELERTVKDFAEKHGGTEDGFASINLDPDSWSLKEIIGHLIDSAANNHQRFVRLQLTDTLNLPAYGLDWLTVEKHNGMQFADLLALWRSYNILLAHLMRTVSPDALDHVWLKDGGEVSLRFLMTDYLEHLKGHVTHFEERLTELNRR